MATRQFKLMGNVYSANSAGIIKVNGIEVFNGSFPTGPIYTDGADPIALTVLEFDNDNWTDSTSPVEISVTQGSIGVGTMQVNYAGIIPNPVYTSDQYSKLVTRAISVAEMVDLEQAVANPPFTEEELTTLRIETLDPTILKQKRTILLEHNAYFHSPGVELFGATPPRSNVTLNDSPVNGSTETAITLVTGDTLKFDQPVFRAVL